MSRQHYQVNEIFHSVQGEGVMAGRMATFIRLQGCPVGCTFCDTEYTWFKGGTRMQLFDIARKVKYPHVVITGGEPLLYDLDNLIAAIHAYTDFLCPEIQVETSGGWAFKGSTLPDWITCSPKLNLNFEIHPDLYRHVDEFKFVVDELLPEKVVEGVEAKLRTKVTVTTKGIPREWPFHIFRQSAFPEARQRPKIVLMPEGCPPRPEMVERSLAWLKRHPEWRISDRLQYRFNAP